MFLGNPISHDGRPKREASYLAAHGHEVTIIGTPAKGMPRRETWRGVRFLRIGVAGQRLVSGVRRLWEAVSAKRRSPESAAPGAVGAAGAATPSHAPAKKRFLRLRLWLGRMRTAVTWVPVGLWHRADVYHAHDLDTLWYAWLCARIRGAKLVYDSHELFPDWQRAIGAPEETVRWMQSIEKRCIGLASLVITVSSGIQGELRRLYGIPDPLVVRNCDVLCPTTRSALLRDRLGGDASRPIILYQGTLDPWRGVREAIIASKQVPEADFVVLGPESPSKEALKALANEQDSRNVFFLPRVSQEELWQYTTGADLGVVLTQPFCASYRFSESNKIFAYMNASVPIVASRGVELHERLTEQTGAVALADPYQPDDIARVIKGLLADRVRLHEMGSQGRLWAEREYNAAHEMEKLRAAYEAMMRPNSPPGSAAEK
jgi:glycosyltransferase involved in cell wall biosynthesis